MFQTFRMISEEVQVSSYSTYNMFSKKILPPLIVVIIIKYFCSSRAQTKLSLHATLSHILGTETVLFSRNPGPTSNW